MANRKFQLKYKSGDNQYDPLNLVTDASLVRRDSNNLPIVGNNAEDLIQNMANLLFPVWGGQMVDVSGFDVNELGKILVLQSPTMNGKIAILNTGEGIGANNLCIYTPDGGENWFKTGNSNNVSWFTKTVCSCLGCYQYDSSTLTNTVDTFLFTMFNDDGQGVSSSGINKFARLSDCNYNINGQMCGNSKTGSPWSTVCCTSWQFIVFSQDGKNLVYTEIGKFEWNIRTIQEDSDLNLHTSFFNPEAVRVIALGDNAYIVSEIDISKPWSIVELDSTKYGKILTGTYDDFGNLYLLTEKCIRKVYREDLTTGEGIDINFPTKFTSDNPIWNSILCHARMLVIASSNEDIAILPLNKLTEEKWRVTRKGKQTEKTTFLVGSGGRLIFISYSQNYFYIGYSYTAPPSGIK